MVRLPKHSFRAAVSDQGSLRVHYPVPHFVPVRFRQRLRKRGPLTPSAVQGRHTNWNMTMKVQTEQEQVIGLTKVAKGRVSREEVNQSGAIQGLLDKLKDLVPNMPRSKKLTKLEIIQNVIDYILDLEIALEAHPTNLSTSSSPMATTRQPLGALPATNSITNALSEDEVTTEKVIRHFAALGSAVAPTNAMSNLDL